MAEGSLATARLAQHASMRSLSTEAVSPESLAGNWLLCTESLDLFL